MRSDEDWLMFENEEWRASLPSIRHKKLPPRNDAELAEHPIALEVVSEINPLNHELYFQRGRPLNRDLLMHLLRQHVRVAAVYDEYLVAVQHWKAGKNQWDDQWQELNAQSGVSRLDFERTLSESRVPRTPPPPEGRALEFITKIEERAGVTAKAQGERLRCIRRGTPPPKSEEELANHPITAAFQTSLRDLGAVCRAYENQPVADAVIQHVAYVHRVARIAYDERDVAVRHLRDGIGEWKE